MGVRPLYAVVATVAVIAAQAHGQELSLLHRLAAGDADAPNQWQDLSAEQRVGLLRDALKSKDGKIAYLAARVLDPDCLSLDEVRLQATVLVSHAEWIRDPKTAGPSWFKGHLRMPIGSPDLPKLWKTAASVEDLPGAAEKLTYFHRALLPEHIPVLVGQLERAGPQVFLGLADTLRLVADYTDEHRAVAARGFLYTLERLRRERRKEPRPRAEDLTVDPRSKAAFLVLAKAAWGLDRDGFRVKGAPSLHPPRAWLVRWAREVALKKGDVPFLSDVVWDVEDPIAKSWAIRQLGALGARELLLELAEGEDSLAVLGAAELARLGEPSRFLELLREHSDWMLPDTLAWYAVPVEARRRRLGEMLLGPNVSDLTPRWRFEDEVEHGVRIRDEDLAWIGENLLKIDAPPPRAAALFFGRAYPRGLTPQVAAGIARGLRDAGTDFDETGIAALLAPLEVANRGALVGTLDHWAANGRGAALPYLARLGEARHVPAMLSAWPDWELEGWELGRVRDRRVEQHLRKRVQSGGIIAVEALAIYYGLPEPLRILLEDPTDEERRLVLKCDPVGAAVHAAKRTRGWRLALLGLAQDERATAYLRALREQRHHGEYWAATAGLALAGDARAREEFGALMREGRIWLLDRLAEHHVLTLGGRPEWIDFWLSRINTNCCLSYIAIDVLTEMYPTFPVVHDGIVDYGQKGRFARKWLDGHTFRPSRVLDGLIPVAQGG